MKRELFAAMLVMTFFCAVLIPAISEQNDDMEEMDDLNEITTYDYYWILGQLPNQTHIYIYAREGANVTFNGTINSPVDIQVPADEFVWYNVGDLGYNQIGTEWYFLELSSDKPLMVNFDRVVNLKVGSDTYEDFHGDNILAKPPVGLNTTYYFANAGSGARDDILVMYSHETTNATVRRYTNGGQTFTRTVNFNGLFVSNIISVWLGPSSPDWDGYGLKVVSEKPVAAALFDELGWYPNPNEGSGFYYGHSGHIQLYDEYMHIHYSASYESYYLPDGVVLSYKDKNGNPVGTPRVFSGETSTTISHSSIGYDTSNLPYLAHVNGTSEFADVRKTPTATDIREAAAYMGWNSSMANLEIYASEDTEIQVFNGRNGTLVKTFSMISNTIFNATLDSQGFVENEPFLVVVLSDLDVYQEVTIPYEYLRQYPIELGPRILPPPLPPFLYINASQNENDILLNWEPPPSPGIEYYLIYRSESQISFDFNTIWINTSNDVNPETGLIEPQTLTWLDKNVTNSTHPDYCSEYYYTIKAVNVDDLRSTSSNTVGYYIRDFQAGANTFALSLEPQESQSLESLAVQMKATAVSWQDPDDEWHTYPSTPTPDAEIGSGYVAVVEIPTDFVFTGEPASMIIHKQGFGFDDMTRDEIITTIDAFGNVNLSWTPISGTDKYYVLRSNIRHGFFTNDYASMESMDTHYVDIGAAALEVELYYLVVPFNNTQGNGSSTYSIGVITEEYYGNEMFGLPLKPIWGDRYADWYVDQIPNALGIVYLKAGIWKAHFKEFPEGVYDITIERGRGYELTVHSMSIFSFVGW